VAPTPFRAITINRVNISNGGTTPVARRNERARATSERGTREGGASRPDRTYSVTADIHAITSTPHGVLRGCAPLTPRYVNTANVKKLAEISYRVITINRVNTSNGGTKPVARRNERARATSERGTREGRR